MPSHEKHLQYALRNLKCLYFNANDAWSGRRVKRLQQVSACMLMCMSGCRPHHYWVVCLCWPTEASSTGTRLLQRRQLSFPLIKQTLQSTCSTFRSTGDTGISVQITSKPLSSWSGPTFGLSSAFSVLLALPKDKGEESTTFLIILFLLNRTCKLSFTNNV